MPLNVTLYELKGKSCPIQVQEWTFIMEPSAGTLLEQLLVVTLLFCV